MEDLQIQKERDTGSEEIDKAELKGLCQNCRHQAACALWRNPSESVVHCEEYEVAGAVAKAAGESFKLPSRQGKKTGSGDTKFKGLCVNCENRKTCTLSKPPGGVWHCEEYS